MVWVQGGNATLVLATNLCAGALPGARVSRGLERYRSEPARRKAS